jgi:hypothetical protein
MADALEQFSRIRVRRSVSRMLAMNVLLSSVRLTESVPPHPAGRNLQASLSGRDPGDY